MQRQTTIDRGSSSFRVRHELAIGAARRGIDVEG
jgi:hypothetical protein